MELHRRLPNCRERTENFCGKGTLVKNKLSKERAFLPLDDKKSMACAQRTRRTSGGKPLSHGYSVETGAVDRAVIYYFTSVPLHLLERKMKKIICLILIGLLGLVGCVRGNRMNTQTSGDAMQNDRPRVMYEGTGIVDPARGEL
jgi:hypothetical protein